MFDMMRGDADDGVMIEREKERGWQETSCYERLLGVRGTGKKDFLLLLLLLLFLSHERLRSECLCAALHVSFIHVFREKRERERRE